MNRGQRRAERRVNSVGRVGREKNADWLRLRWKRIYTDTDIRRNADAVADADADVDANAEAGLGAVTEAGAEVDAGVSA
eukprot:1187775-Prorocentrum_minimum.AAC.1